MSNPTMYRSDGWVKSAQGPAVPGAQIYVAQQPANSGPPAPTPLVDIFSDPNGLVPITQPIITDGFGHYNFYVAPGTYTLVVYLGGRLSTLYADQSIGLGQGTAGSVILRTEGVNNPDQDVLDLTSDDGSVVLTANDDGGVDLSVSSSAAAPIFGETLPGWWGSGEGSNYPAVTSATGRWGTGTANQVKVWMIRLPYNLNVNKLTTRTVGPLALSTSSFGVYDSTGTHKLFAFEGFVTTTSGVTLTKTLGATVTLKKGIYIMACACDTSGTPPTTLGGYTATGSNEGVEPWNTNGTVRSGTAANPMVGTVLPATLGTLSPGGSNFDPLPLWIMEP